eukprot:12905015-Prorocentrum_lima.AAC.1
MHLHCVKTFHSCDLAAEHPQRTSVCRNRTISMAKVNTPFPAMVMEDRVPALQSHEINELPSFQGGSS